MDPGEGGSGSDEIWSEGPGAEVPFCWLWRNKKVINSHSDVKSNDIRVVWFGCGAGIMLVMKEGEDIGGWCLP